MIEYFDGEVRHQPPAVGGKGWIDEWWGPGGHLIVTQISRHTPAGQLDVDALETLYRPDGTTIQYALAEGANYQTLPELMGPYWEKYQSGIVLV